MVSIPITILCGFLGSGKTTLLRRWQRDDALCDAAVIVHDLSEFGLDAELLSADGAKPRHGELAGRVAALHGAHARELLQASVQSALLEIAELVPKPTMLIVESTGAAHPWPLLSAFTRNSQFSLRHFIVTVDALSLHRDFSDGLSLCEDPAIMSDPALRYAASILVEQIAFASIIILTKTDTIAKTTVDAQVRALQKLQPRAAIGLSAQAGLQFSQLDGVPAPSMADLQDRAEQLGLLDFSAASATADEVDCLIFRDPRPFHPARLHDACQQHLGTGLYRTKGYFWMASRPAHVLLWQQSGSQITLEFTGLWRAELAHNRDGKLLPEEVIQLKAMLAEKNPIFGDRHNELTLIGLRHAREAFAAALQDALCTEQEISAWRNGEFFPDPWPQKLRKID